MHGRTPTVYSENMLPRTEDHISLCLISAWIIILNGIEAGGGIKSAGHSERYGYQEIPRLSRNDAPLDMVDSVGSFWHESTPISSRFCYSRDNNDSSLNSCYLTTGYQSHELRTRSQLEADRKYRVRYPGMPLRSTACDRDQGTCRPTHTTTLCSYEEYYQ